MDIFELLGLGNFAHRASRPSWRHQHETYWVVDTCATTDGGERYETGIRHYKIEEGACVIVEEYDSAEAAWEGHERWIKKMSAGPVTELTDVSTCPSAKLCDGVSGTSWRTKRARN